MLVMVFSSNSWDDANRASTSSLPGGTSAVYRYDADGKRASKKVTVNSAVTEDKVYIYAGPNCIAEYNYGGATNVPVMEYIYAGEIDSLALIARNNNAQKMIATRNQQWSIVSLCDNANGTVLERYTYDQFGKRKILAADGSTVRTSSSYDNPYGYTSRRHDAESGLMYFRARYYDPTTGEFTSRDPLEYVDGMSAYRGYFTLANVDPSGAQEEPIPQIGVFFGGAAENLLHAKFRWTMAELYEEYAGNEKKFVTPGVPANPLTLFDAHKDVCTWSCQHFAACEIWAVDIFAFSRGVPLAIDLANRLNFEGCDCGETKILPVRIRFLGLIDPVVRAVFGLPIKYPYSAPPNVAFAIQHVRSLIGQTAKDAQFPLSPVPNVWRTTWGPWDRDGKLVPAEHGNMGNPNNPNDIVGLGAAVKRTLKAEAASVGVRWK